MACNQRYPTNIENSSTQNTGLIGCFTKVSMKLFELEMVDRVININCRHLRDVFLLISVTYVTFYTKLQIMTLENIYKNESCSPTPGRKSWKLFSVRDMSWGLRNPCFF